MKQARSRGFTVSRSFSIFLWYWTETYLTVTPQQRNENQICTGYLMRVTSKISHLSIFHRHFVSLPEDEEDAIGSYFVDKYWKFSLSLFKRSTHMKPRWYSLSFVDVRYDTNGMIWKTSYVKKSNQNTNKQSATCWALYIPEPTDRKILFWVPSSISRPHLGNDNDTQLIDNFIHIFPFISRSGNHWFTNFFDQHHSHHRSGQRISPSKPGGINPPF